MNISVMTNLFIDSIPYAQTIEFKTALKNCYLNNDVKQYDLIFHDIKKLVTIKSRQKYFVEIKNNKIHIINLVSNYIDILTQIINIENKQNFSYENFRTAA
jgi:hypothetical protein